jgi:actin-like protein 6A
MSSTTIATPGGDDVNALVLDVGSSTFRAGFSGEDLPRIVENSTFRFPTDNDIDMGNGNIPYSPVNYLSRTSPCSMRYAIRSDSKSSSIDMDGDALEQIIQYSFKNPRSTLELDLGESPLIMTEPNKPSIKYRKTCLDTAFEKFDFPAVSLIKRATGSAFASGKQSGLVIDIGASMTSVTPVYDGFVLQRPAVEFFGVGGDMLDTILDELLKKKRVNVMPFYRRTDGLDPKFINSSRLAVVRELKHELCRMSPSSLSSVPGYASWHIATEGQVASSVLPDGSPVDIAPFHQVLPELLFDAAPVHAIPSMAPLVQSFNGIGAAALETIANCDIDARKAISSEVILTGGSSLFPHLPERLLKFLQTPESKGPNNLIPIQKPKVTASPVSCDRMCSSWLGASIVASCATFQHLWISRKQYQEQGMDHIAEKQLLW